MKKPPGSHPGVSLFLDTVLDRDNLPDIPSTRENGMLQKGEDLTNEEKTRELSMVMGWREEDDRFLFGPEPPPEGLADLFVVRYPGGQPVVPRWYDPFADACDLSFVLAYMEEAGWPMDEMYEIMDDHPVTLVRSILDDPADVAGECGRVLGLWA